VSCKIPTPHVIPPVGYMAFFFLSLPVLFFLSILSCRILDEGEGRVRLGEGGLGLAWPDL
jgi:hypothetical protein